MMEMTMNPEEMTRDDTQGRHLIQDNPMGKDVGSMMEVTRKDLLTAMIDAGKSIERVEIKEVTMGPTQKAPLHLHPSPTLGVITEGLISFQIEGEPVQYLKAGDAFYESANVRVAKFDNDGDAPAKFVVFYLLEKDEHETVRILPR